MSKSYKPPERFVELLQRCVDGEVSPDDHRHLEEAIRDNAEARQLYADFLQLHSSLGNRAIGLGIGGDRHTLDAPCGETSRSDNGGVVASYSRRTFSARVAVALSVLAATLLICIGATVWDTSEEFAVADGASDNQPRSENRVFEADKVSRPPAPVATLAGHELAVCRDREIYVGQPIHEGETLHLEEGRIFVSVGYGADIQANGPCSLTFTANDQVRLNEGDIFVDVAEWAKGFTVLTKAMDVVDLGTTFSVSAGDGLATETSVISGMVRALPHNTPAGDSRSILLSEGEGLAIDDQGNRRSFVPKEEKARSEVLMDGPAPYRPVRLHNTGIGLSVGDEDPHWRVITGPDGAVDAPCYARVCLPYERYLDNDPAVSQWVSIPGWESAAPNSVYTFATTFELEGYDLATTRLFGRFLADNGIKAVRVNGKPVRVESWADNVSGQRFEGQQFRFVNVTAGLVDGHNAVEIDVANGTTRDRGTGLPNNVPNHMALRVEWYAFGRGADLAAASEEGAKQTGNSVETIPATLLHTHRSLGISETSQWLDDRRVTFLSPSTNLAHFEFR